MASHATHSAQFDELDPHGAGKGGQHESHVIVGPITLRLVLLVLLFLTVLTVGQAQAEVYIAREFHVDFPKWVNVAFCMAIAVVKALLVMAYFMQLKYDNPINSVVMAFTFLALALFLGFTALDLGTRSSVYSWKASGTTPGGVSELVKKARDKAITNWGVEKFNLRKAEYEAGHGGHGHSDAHGAALSSDAMSRPSTGLSGALSATPPVAHGDGHGDEHGAATPGAPGQGATAPKSGEPKAPGH